jgi:hypothetical protein
MKHSFDPHPPQRDGNVYFLRLRKIPAAQAVERRCYGAFSDCLNGFGTSSEERASILDRAPKKKSRPHSRGNPQRSPAMLDAPGVAPIPPDRLRVVEGCG